MRRQKIGLLRARTSEQAGSGTCVTNDRKTIIPQSSENASPNFGPERGCLSVTLELLFTVVGVCWTVSRFMDFLDKLEE